MSGHSKWSSIKHKKAATDAKKGKLFSKISRMLSIAVRERGPNPDTNPALRLAMEKAKEANMPSENVQRLVKKYSVVGERLEEVQFEGYGPGGVALIIDAITDSRNRTSQEIRHIFSLHGGSLAAPGSVRWMFERYGEVVVDPSGKSREELELAAIEAGAEDIRDESGKLTVVTKPEDLWRVRKSLEEKGMAVQKADFDYRTAHTVTLQDPALKAQAERLFEALDESDDVQDIYSNAEFK